MDNHSVSDAAGYDDSASNSGYPYDISATEVLYQWSASASVAASSASAAAASRLAPSASPSGLPPEIVGEPPGMHLLSPSDAANETARFSLLDYGMGLNMNMNLANTSEGYDDYSAYQQQMVGGCRQMEGNMSYWNLTCDSPLDYALPLYGYCMPFLMIITIISNTLIVLVLSKKSMATPTNFVLMGELRSSFFKS